MNTVREDGLSRRERPLAVNAVLSAVLTAWEQQHVVHHLKELRSVRPVTPGVHEPTNEPPADSPAVPLAA